MASKRRNMFHKNKTQETTEKGCPITYNSICEDWVISIWPGHPRRREERSMGTRLLHGRIRRARIKTDLGKKMSNEDGELRAPLDQVRGPDNNKGGTVAFCQPPRGPRADKGEADIGPPPVDRVPEDHARFTAPVAVAGGGGGTTVKRPCTPAISF
ncbi:hypothetical protein AAG570_000314 [Ranatra chinensis]|uniref:Uncharacterized protein n=1 Tax=Ranatra chinensis TaxID=642074 RepID=A0ABD0Z748_9HEMI